jgi:peptide/nickel transport system ATP-binding protein
MRPVIENSRESVLDVRSLCVDFDTKNGPVRVLDDISFTLNAGSTLGIVGESGCGKSMTALALMGLIPSPPGRISGGEILLHGEDLVTAGQKRLRQLRGEKISMIFQEPMTSLNPVYTIGNQISESIIYHQDVAKKEARERTIELLRSVQIPSPERRVDDYPHQLSGGMRQRVMIAMALACEPQVLIADEPTTALDVTVQAQIFELLLDIQQQREVAIILITHDMGAIAEVADDVVVMYAGHKIEEGTTVDVVNNPYHPYTQGLLRCMPDLKEDVSGVRQPLFEIAGNVPDLAHRGSGCPFAPRCPVRFEKCSRLPETRSLENGRHIKCWQAQSVAPLPPETS